MNSANGLKCAICYDSICCDSTKYQSIKLKCGHAFGKSCMRKWIESSNQKKCLLCRNPLTDSELSEIKNISLKERAVIISEKTVKLFGQTVFKIVHSLASWTPLAFAAGGVGFGMILGHASAERAGAAFGTAAWSIKLAAGVAAATTGVALGTAVSFTAVAAGVAAGAVCAAAGVDRGAARAFGAIPVAVCAGIGVTGAIGITAGTGFAEVVPEFFGLLAGGTGIYMGTFVLEMEVLGTFGLAAYITGSAISIPVVTGAIICDEMANGFPIGMTSGTFGLIGGIVAGALGAIGANTAYDEQQINPVIV